MLTIIPVLFTAWAHAQRGAPMLVTPPVDIAKMQQVGIVMYDNIQEISEKAGAVEAAVYLRDDWSEGTILTSSGHELANVLIKYDIKNNVLELATQEGTKVLSGNYVRQFELKEGNTAPKTRFINSKSLGGPSDTHTGFYEILTSGARAQLLVRIELIREKPNYSPIMDVGSKRSGFRKKETLCMESNSQVVEVKDKDIYNLFGTYQDDMKRYAKSNKLKLKKREDAVRLINYYNSFPQS
ncbi:hypothetical protein CLV24_11944 [Pontibacter ummariensis]|uniref:Uncharacterized protein n=2 Tax=Pontibacter ummariensis TaxID=1610492 RepID=A0A239IZN7_9BACT|nr:hypothetical protein CLV24_11944 [Pontibacter ummariensis]SNS97874.1 hypothetical protein SAMN06296052_11944 [Pontibacter ummariensis]